MTHRFFQFVLPENTAADDTHARARIGSLSGWIGIVCNLLLFGGKLAVASISGSVAIAADAWNNLSDASGSIVTLIGFRLADKPADPHHPYGHARFEYLSALAVSAMILAIGFELGKASLEKILTPEPVEFTTVTFWVLAVSIAIKLGMYFLNRSLGKKLHSTALIATAQDSRNDCIATAAVLLSGLLTRFVDAPLDGWMGLAVAVFILVSGWRSARQTISPLLGESADPELRQKIGDYIASHPKVLGYHDLMVHDYGPGSRFASIHVEMDRSEDPLVCHELIDDMERECLRSHNVHLVIHYDPVVTDDPELLRMRQVVSSILQVRHEGITVHDFRMVPGDGHTNLIFDAVLPPELRGQEKELQTSLEHALSRLGETRYYTVITFDQTDFN